MTIKQQGGIFGRNPTFNDVTVDGDLTVNGNTTGGDSTLSGITVEGNNNGGSWSTDSVNKITLKDLDSSVGQQRLGQIDWYTSDTTSTGVASSIYAITNNTSGISSLKFATGNSSTIDDSLTIAFDGNVTVDRGNLVIGTSGQGIDFSATSGTGTSELFDDYEEGNWTPVVSDATSGGNTASITVVGAKYIKVGKIVHLYARINNINTSGMTSGNAVSIQGLPFASGVDVFSCGSCVLDRIGAGGDTTINPRIDESSSFMQLAVTSSANGTSDANLLVSQIGSTGSDIHSLQITYEAS